MISVAIGVYSIAEALSTGVHVPGYATIVVSVTFLSGVQLLFLGVIGEYIGRIYTEVKQRPLYLVDQSVGLEPDDA
jgi:glycosyltransferase involved in cell wall biosynthesis